MEELQISDHALIRYLERVKGIDMKVISDEIRSQDILKCYYKLGHDGKYFSNGWVLVIKNHMIVTIHNAKTDWELRKDERRIKSKNLKCSIKNP